MNAKWARVFQKLSYGTWVLGLLALILLTSLRPARSSCFGMDCVAAFFVWLFTLAGALLLGSIFNIVSLCLDPAPRTRKRKIEAWIFFLPLPLAFLGLIMI